MTAVNGDVATLPEAEFRAILATLRSNAVKQTTLGASQRRAMLELVDEGILRLEAMRADLISPLAPRLRKLMVE